MKIQVCYCGTNHDAMEAAMRAVRQTIKYHFDGKDGRDECAIWLASVLASMQIVMTQLAGEAIRGVYEEGGNEIIGEELANTLNRIEGAQWLTLEESDTRKELAKFMCDECGLPADRKRIEDGPSKESFQETKERLGYATPTPILERLRALLGKDVKVMTLDEVMQDEINPPVDRSKAH